MRFYRALLRLYPSSFRTEYGQALCAAFEERMRGRSGLAMFFAALADVVPNAIAVHLDILGQDVRFTARALRRAPGFAFTAILVVALGVGANTAAFSLADFVLLRPLPFAEPDRLVKLWLTTPGYTSEFSPANFRDWSSMAKSFTGMAAYFNNAANLTGGREPRRIATARVTPELMPLMGVPAVMGRVIASQPGDPEAGTPDSVAVISHGLWRSHFGGDRNVVGRTLRLDGTPYTVIGVMPPTYRFPSREVDVWTPLRFTGDDFQDRNDNYLDVVARLRPGVTLRQAGAELDRIAALLQRQYPDENRDVGATAQLLKAQVAQSSRLLVLSLCGAALCILLLACANLASLLLARGLNRTRELAVRTALGAGRERLVRQLITESLGLSLIGGAIGVGMAMAGAPLLARLVPSSLPIDSVPSIDLRVLAFATVLIVLTGLASGVAPALRGGKTGPLEALRADARAGGGQRRRMRSILVMIEVTASIVLLVSSGLLMRAIWRIHSVEPGFRAEGVMTLRTALPFPKYETTASRERFYTRVLQETRALPGVRSAGYISGLPMVMRGGIWPVAVKGANTQRDTSNSASLRFATPGLLPSLGIRLHRGRDISDGDTRQRPFVAVVSESFARRQWPGHDPIGKTFGFALSDRTVVGVVDDVRVRGLERTSEPQVYVPSGQVDDSSLTGYVPKDLVIRSSMPPERLIPALRRIIASADPEQPLSDIKPLAEILADDTAPRRVQLRVLMILSTLALLIAGVGIHGLLSFAVAQRTQELGVRKALGAQSGTIVGMVMKEGLGLALVGALAGVAIAIFIGRAMSALLFGLSPADPQTILAAVGLGLLTALAGCLRPALRAARIDPMTALRET
jgi:putative ABC transport system permease protein